MSFSMVKLGDIAPSKPLKSPSIRDQQLVWQLNLDMVEANSGNVKAKAYGSIKSAGSSTHWFNEQHVLYSKLRPYLNKVVVPDEQGLATTELVPLLPDPQKLDRKYLAYYLRSNNFVNWISDQVAGAKMPRVSMKVFWEHQIPLPPLDEQKRIAAILDKADAIRRKRQQAIQLADDFLRSVFLDMFGDPVTNPKGWEVGFLKEHIVHANNGLSRRRKTEENVGDIVLRLQDVHYDGIRFEKELNRIVLDDKEKPRYQLEEGDLLFIRVNGNPDYVGRSAVFKCFDEPVYHNDHLIRLRFDREYNSNFLSYTFNLAGGRKIISEKTKTSAGQHTISQGGIESLQFYIPPRKLQDEFVSLQNNVHSLMLKNLKGALYNSKCFKSLCKKAFAGEL